MQSAGLIYDESFHYIDHLAPFCSWVGLPLITCEPSVTQLARRYYPSLEVIEKNILELSLPPSIITCDTLPLIQATFPHQYVKTVWLPHGNSDKGWKSPFFEALQGEKIALVYGQKMIDFMKAKNVHPTTHSIGNFRFHYYQMHHNFYEQLLKNEFGTDLQKPIFLYAPTWDDSEKNGSLWEALPALASGLPDHYTLFVKLHPNIRKQSEVRLERLIGLYEKRKNIRFIEDFPPIYPLLSLVDAYIGDMSSIGYDFLTFDKPLFFLNPNRRDRQTDQGLYLYRCGTEISPEQFSTVFNLYKQSDLLSLQRKEAYHYTFSLLPNPTMLGSLLCALSA